MYDTRRGRAVLFGGCEDKSNSEVGIQRSRGDTWELGPDPEAATLAFGRACRGSVGYATLSTAERPVPGNAAFALRLAGLPAWAPIALAVGARSTHQPLGADCSLWVATWLAVLASRSDGVGTGAFPLSIPANPALLGATLYTQGAAGDSAAPTGVVWTGGLQVRIGW